MQVGIELGLAHGLGPAQRSATWLLLKNFNDLTGYCCPKIATLASAEGVNEAAMGRTLFRLMQNSFWERRMVGILYHYDLPTAVASTIVAAKVAHDGGVIFDIESHYLSEIDRLGDANNRPHFGSIEHLNTDHGVNGTDHGVNGTDHGVNGTDHGDRSEKRKKRSRKDLEKKCGSSNDFGNFINEGQDPKPAPRPALIPVATLTEPETAVAVYNTLEIDDHEKEDPSMDDLTRARAAELLEIEQEIGNRLRSEIFHDADELEKVRHQLAETRRRRRHLETLLSDEEWHARARTAAATGSERLVDVIAALVVQRWPDFPYQIEWSQRLAQMVEAYRAAGRRGRDLLDDVLAASAAEERDLALMILMAQSLHEEEENATDDRDDRDDRDEDLHALPADQEPEGIQRRQEHVRRPSSGLQGVLQRPAAEKAAVPQAARQEKASPAVAAEVPALPAEAAAAAVPSTQPPTGSPEPAVQSLP